MRSDKENAYSRYPAKKTEYRGVWFRSNLEAKVAERLDGLGIAWEYETRCFRDKRFSGGQYTPDFWLPECYTYLEVAGVIDERHMNNALVFCETQNVNNPSDDPSFNDIPPLLAEDTPAYFFIDGTGEVRDPFHMDSYLVLVGCKADCGHRSFVHSCGDYACRICGAYDGDHSLLGDAYL